MLKQILIVLITLNLLIAIQSTPVDNDCKPHQVCVKLNEKTNKIEPVYPQEYCNLCTYIIPIMRGFAKKNDTRIFTTLANYICTNLKIADKHVCSEAIKIYKVIQVVLI